MSAAAEILLPVRDYDLAATLDSGQAFRWQRVDHSWHGVIGRHSLRLTQTADGLHAVAHAPVTDWDFLRHFLQTEVDLAAVLQTFPDDAPMRAAVAHCRGLRLLRQDPWECLASFILSSTKQIVQIRQIVALLCENFGEPLSLSASNRPSATLAPSDAETNGVRIRPIGISRLETLNRRNVAQPSPAAGSGGVSPPVTISGRDAQATRRRDADATGFMGRVKQLCSFPTPDQIAALTEAQLRACKMGFRAPNLLLAAREIADGKLNLEHLRALDYAAARAALMTLRGVGGKIADCVLLFAYGFDTAFPVDVWIERALQELYFPRRRASEKRLRHFAAHHFGPHAGYAQQYLFHYMRTKS